MTNAIVQDHVQKALDDAQWLIANDMARIKRDFITTGCLKPFEDKVIANHLKSLQITVATRAALSVTERLEDLTDHELRDLMLADPEIARVFDVPKLPSH